MKCHMCHSPGSRWDLSSSADSAEPTSSQTAIHDSACAKDGLINFQFEPVNPHLRKLFPKPTKAQIMKWIAFWTATVNYFVAFGLDIWVAIGLFMDHSWDEAISYAVFSGSSIALAIYELKTAREIILSDDVSDAVKNIQARRFYGCISYYHFLLWDKIEEQKTFKDKFFLFIYGTYKNGLRLLFIQTPQLVLCFVKMCNSDGCSTDPAIITKTIQLGFSLWALLFTMLIYPFLRLYFCCKYGPKFSFADYCLLMTEQHVNKVLTPLLEKEDPESLKTLQSQQKEKGGKKKKESTPPTADPEKADGSTTKSTYPRDSIIEKAKALPRLVYSLDDLASAAIPLAKENIPLATAAAV